ncbi:hypothetical protein LSAT2_014371, partial [Lamellibrachia satsuma]
TTVHYNNILLQQQLPTTTSHYNNRSLQQQLTTTTVHYNNRSLQQLIHYNNSTLQQQHTTTTAHYNNSSLQQQHTTTTMGFDSGDGVHHYVLPGSYKASAKDVELTTNVGVLGRWLFRVDGDTVVAGRIAAGDAYDCDNNSPCTAANRALGKYFFACVDMSTYIQCDAFSRCMVRPCAPGTVFKASISTCVHA